MLMVLLSYGMGFGVRMDGRTDSHVTTKIFEIDGLPNFLRYGAQLACLSARRSSAINLQNKSKLIKILTTSHNADTTISSLKS